MNTLVSLSLLGIIAACGVMAYQKLKQLKQLDERKAKPYEGRPYDFEALPTGAYLHYQDALVLISKRQLEAAIEELKAAVEIIPNHRGLLLKLGEVYINAKQFDKAQEIASVLIEDSPADNYVLYFQGLIQHFQGNLDEALKSYDAALYRRMPYVSPYLYRAQILLEKRDFNRVQADIDRAKQIDSKDAQVYLFEGLLKRAQNQPQEALEAFEKGLSLNPNYLEILTNLTGLADEMGQYQKALEYTNQAVNLVSDSAINYSNRGYILYRLERFQEAIVDFNRAIEINPQFAHSYLYRGLTFTALKNPQAAYDDYTCLLEIEPQNYWAYNNRASALNKLKKYEEALVNAEKAISIDANIANAYLVRGFALGRLNKYDEAIKNYDKVLELNPTWGDAYNSRAWAKTILGDYEGALADAEQAITLKPEYGSFYDTRAQVKWCVGDYEAALEDYQQAITYADEALPIYTLGKAAALYKLGHEEEALAVWREAQPVPVEDLQNEYRFAPPFYQCLLELEKRSASNG